MWRMRIENSGVSGWKAEGIINYVIASAARQPRRFALAVMHWLRDCFVVPPRNDKSESVRVTDCSDTGLRA